MGRVSQEAKRRYYKKTYDHINLYVKKGKKEEIRLYADAQGKGLNRYVTDLIIREMEKSCLSAASLSMNGLRKVINEQDTEPVDAGNLQAE